MRKRSETGAHKTRDKFTGRNVKGKRWTLTNATPNTAAIRARTCSSLISKRCKKMRGAHTVSTKTKKLTSTPNKTADCGGRGGTCCSDRSGTFERREGVCQPEWHGGGGGGGATSDENICITRMVCITIVLIFVIGIRLV